MLINFEVYNVNQINIWVSAANYFIETVIVKMAQGFILIKLYFYGNNVKTQFGIFYSNTGLN